MFDEYVYNRDVVGERYWIMGYMGLNQIHVKSTAFYYFRHWGQLVVNHLSFLAPTRVHGHHFEAA